ncbi:MAG: HD-GYP domain-containing protein, partial [Desulfotomaculales bacterium]
MARIIRVADAYDAMTSVRPCQRLLTAEEAIEELRRGAGRQLDPRVGERSRGFSRGDVAGRCLKVRLTIRPIAGDVSLVFRASCLSRVGRSQHSLPFES